MLTLHSLHQGAENCSDHISENTLPYSRLFIHLSHTATTCCCCCCGRCCCFVAFSAYPQEHLPEHRGKSKPLLLFCFLQEAHQPASTSIPHRHLSIIKKVKAFCRKDKGERRPSPDRHFRHRLLIQKGITPNMDSGPQNEPHLV